MSSGRHFQVFFHVFKWIKLRGQYPSIEQGKWFSRITYVCSLQFSFPSGHVYDCSICFMLVFLSTSSSAWFSKYLQDRLKLCIVTGGDMIETCTVRYLSDSHTEALERHGDDPPETWRTKKGVMVQLSSKVWHASSGAVGQKSNPFVWGADQHVLDAGSWNSWPNHAESLQLTRRDIGTACYPSLLLLEDLLLMDVPMGKCESTTVRTPEFAGRDVRRIPFNRKMIDQLDQKSALQKAAQTSSDEATQLAESWLLAIMLKSGTQSPTIWKCTFQSFREMRIFRMNDNEYICMILHVYMLNFMKFSLSAGRTFNFFRRSAAFPSTWSWSQLRIFSYPKHCKKMSPRSWAWSWLDRWDWMNWLVNQAYPEYTIGSWYVIAYVNC